MSAYLLALWQKFYKSATMWYGAILTSLPITLPWIQQNWPEVSKYLPPTLQSKVMFAVGAGVVLARLKSMVVPPKS